MKEIAMLALMVAFAFQPAEAQHNDGTFEQNYVNGIFSGLETRSPSPTRGPGAGDKPSSQPASSPDDKKETSMESSISETAKEDPCAGAALASPGAVENDPSKKIVSIGAVLSGNNRQDLTKNLKTYLSLLKCHKVSAGSLYISGDADEVADIMEEALPRQTFTGIFRDQPDKLSSGEYQQGIEILKDRIMNNAEVSLIMKVVENLRVVSGPVLDLDGVEIKLSPSWIIETAKDRVLLEGMAQPGRYITSRGYFVAPAL